MERHNDAILAKIKKLFLLAEQDKNNSEAEAYAALIKAQDLMVQYGLSQAQVDGVMMGKQETPEEVDSGVYGKRTSPFHWMVAKIIADNTRCFYWRTTIYETVHGYSKKVGYSMKFLGTETDVQIAVASFKFVLAEGQKNWKRFWNSYLRENGQPPKGFMSSYRDSYYSGFSQGLRSAYEQNVESKALIIVKPDSVVEAHRVRSRHFQSSKTRMLNSFTGSSAYAAGQRDGSASLNRRSITA